MASGAPASTPSAFEITNRDTSTSYRRRRFLRLTMSPPITPAVAVPAAFRPPPRPPARVRRRRRHGSVAPAHPPRRCRGSYRAQRLPDVPTADASPCAGIDHLAYRGCKGTSVGNL
ncbi:hypothetical protein PAHAL_8G110800 [Panicum hallii]|uniref:Uncharacterized protein n=1 Tax=Panicum hallii TaxID=206008 RepID=A0A2T8I8G5_9POAL|nr:hypothetical protein PAHAL_8G110800 [Panicum hallii]